MASQPGVFNPQQFTDAGAPAASYRLYTLQQGTATHKAAYTDPAGLVPHTYTSDGAGGLYIALNVRGELPAPLFLASGAYDLALKTPAGATVWTRYAAGASDSAATVGAEIRADIASTSDASKGDALVGVKLPGTSTSRTQHAKNLEVLSVADFGAVGDGATDDTAAIQAAIDYVQAVGATDPHDPSFTGAGINIGRLLIPAGVYRITAPLVISKPCVIFGDGVRRTIIRFATADNTLFAFNIGPTNSGQNLIGGSFGGMSIISNAGSVAAGGVYVSSAATASAVTIFTLHDLGIYNVRVGVSITGVVYMCTFRNITVTGTFGGTVGLYGWYVTSTLEVIYNTFSDLEVTGCGNGAYAYWCQVLATQFRNLTADAPCYFSNPYGTVKGLSIEGLSAATLPTNVVITLNQCDALEDVAIINCPAAKTSIGISVVGRSNIRNVRWPDSGAGNQPSAALLLYGGSSGTVSGYQVGRAVTNLVEAGGTAESDMNNWVFTGCSDVTAHDVSYRIGAWTPTYPSGWTTAPTTISAQYTRVGRQITVTLYGQNGVATAGAQIGGLPFVSGSTQGAAVYGCSSDAADVLRGSILPSTTTITSIPAATLTGSYWQMTATYFA